MRMSKRKRKSNFHLILDFLNVKFLFCLKCKLFNVHVAIHFVMCEFDLEIKAYSDHISYVALGLISIVRESSL